MHVCTCCDTLQAFGSHVYDGSVVPEALEMKNKQQQQQQQQVAAVAVVVVCTRSSSSSSSGVPLIRLDSSKAVAMAALMQLHMVVVFKRTVRYAAHLDRVGRGDTMCRLLAVRSTVTSD
jgi:hypothetical protein